MAGVYARTAAGQLLAQRFVLDLPLKVLAWEDSTGARWVAFNEPDYLQKRHSFPPELLKNIAGLAALAAAAAGP